MSDETSSISQSIFHSLRAEKEPVNLINTATESLPTNTHQAVNATDTVDIQQHEESGQVHREKSPWWSPTNLLKQAGFIGLNIGGSIAGGAIGFMLGGPPGAIIGASVAGAGVSGLTSVLEQRFSGGKIDWGQVGIESAIGGIPLGGIGNAAVKSLSRLGINVLKEGSEGIVAQFAKGALSGATEGSILGAGQGAATSAYQQSKEGEISLTKLTEDTLSGIVGGALGGGVFGGGLNVAVSRFSSFKAESQTNTNSLKENIATVMSRGEQRQKEILNLEKLITTGKASDEQVKKYQLLLTVTANEDLNRFASELGLSKEVVERISHEANSSLNKEVRVEGVIAKLGNNKSISLSEIARFLPNLILNPRVQNRIYNLLKVRESKYSRLTSTVLSERFINGSKKDRIKIMIECFPGFTKLAQNADQYISDPDLVSAIRELKENGTPTYTLIQANQLIRNTNSSVELTSLLGVGSINEAYLSNYSLGSTELKASLLFMSKYGLPLYKEAQFETVAKIQKNFIDFESLQAERDLLLDLVEELVDSEQDRRPIKRFITEFYENVQKELDLTIEAQNALKLAQTAQGFKVAKPFQATKTTLLMEKIDGKSITAISDILEKYDPNDPNTFFSNPEFQPFFEKYPELMEPVKFLESLMEEFASMLGHQSYISGIMHADLQGGNIIVGTKGKDLMQLIDTGNIYERPPNLIIDEVGYLYQVMRKDSKGIAERVINNADSLPIDTNVNELVNLLSKQIQLEIFDKNINLTTDEGRNTFQKILKVECDRLGIERSAEGLRYIEALFKAKGTFDRLANIYFKLTGKRQLLDNFLINQSLTGFLFSFFKNPIQVLNEIVRVGLYDIRNPIDAFKAVLETKKQLDALK